MIIGTEGDGGGIHCDNSNANIQNNIIYSNFALVRGGAIYCENSNVVIRDNIIHDNYGIFGGGGAIYCDSSSPEIHNNIIEHNWTDLGNGGGICCDYYSSPEISNNRIAGNYTYDGAPGGGISCTTNSSPLIIDNTICDNYLSTASDLDLKYEDESSSGGGGGIYIYNSSPIIANNLIYNNSILPREFSNRSGAGIACQGYSGPTIFNNRISGNMIIGFTGMHGYGGGIFCGEDSSPVIVNNTIMLNYGDGNISMHGGGVYCETSSAVIENCIVWDNYPDEIDGCDGLVTYSDVHGGYPDPGETNIDSDPHFVVGPDGCSYLSHIATGQADDSLCIDAGSDLAENICYDGPGGEICLGDFTTRIDHVNDTGMVDMGYHHGNGLSVPCPSTVAADLTCMPSSGTLPFTIHITATLSNIYRGQIRWLAAKIHLTLGGGGYFANWRSGYTNISRGDSYIWAWNQNLPALGTLVGDNIITFVAEDVTPAPYNQPPYPPAGDTDTAFCTVTGIAP